MKTGPACTGCWVDAGDRLSGVRFTELVAASLPASRTVGQLLREWSQRRRLSQMDLVIQAEISAWHLTFAETGRSRPTSDMIMQLDVPLRDRNAAAGTRLRPGLQGERFLAWEVLAAAAVASACW